MIVRCDQKYYRITALHVAYCRGRVGYGSSGFSRQRICHGQGLADAVDGLGLLEPLKRVAL